MRKLFFLLTCVLISFSSYAYDGDNNLRGSLAANPIVDQVSYSIDLGDITNVGEEEITNSINEFISKIPPSKLDCSVTVKAEINVGVGKESIELTVSGPCSEILEKGKEIADQVIKGIKEQLKEQLSQLDKMK